MECRDLDLMDKTFYWSDIEFTNFWISSTFCSSFRSFRARISNLQNARFSAYKLHFWAPYFWCRFVHNLSELFATNVNKSNLTIFISIIWRFAGPSNCIRLAGCAVLRVEFVIWPWVEGHKVANLLHFNHWFLQSLGPILANYSLSR